MRKVLKNNQKTNDFLNSLPKIYLVGCWAKYGVRDYPFTGQYETNENGISIPLVYHYDDHNGITDHYYLRRLDHVTTGQIILWTQFRNVANKVAEMFNEEMEE